MCGEQIDRIPALKMTKLPHRHIGAIICLGYTGQLQYGTGTLISKNLVLTCAHVIYNK